MNYLSDIDLILSIIKENIFIVNTFLLNNALLLFLSLIVCLIAFCFYIIFLFEEIKVDTTRFRVSKYNRRSDIPPHYPNGWIPVLESVKIKVKQSALISVFGQDLVLFRGVSGNLFVLDAYCPHLGANIGVGGTVIDDCIKCPFHGWIFRGTDGYCTHFGQNTESMCQTPGARIKVWESVEVNGMVFVWYHANKYNPNWYPNKIQEIEDSKWIYRGRTEHIVMCHFQEIPENGADVAHLNQIHSQPLIFGSNFNKIEKYQYISNILSHKWTSNWMACEPPNQHMSAMTLQNKNLLFGYPLLELNLSIQQIGPAYVILKFNTQFLGGINGTFIQFITPMEPNKNKIVHHVYTERSFKAKVFSKFLLYGEAKMLERDIIIWNNKRFVKNALLTKNDKFIVKFRRWFTQFYSENSVCDLNGNNKIEW